MILDNSYPFNPLGDYDPIISCARLVHSLVVINKPSVRPFLFYTESKRKRQKNDSLLGLTYANQSSRAR